MKTSQINEKIQKLVGNNDSDPIHQENEINSANFAIQNRFYDEKEGKDHIDTSVSTSNNIGAVLLPVKKET